MTYLQGVFSLHAIFCYFYGGVTFFNTDLTVKMGLSHPEWSGQQYTVLMKMHGACVLGLGLVCISAAQFDEAESRNKIARSMLGMTALVFMALWQDWREGGYSQTPVVFGVGVTTLAYLLGCTLLMDKEAPKKPVMERSSPDSAHASKVRKEE